MFICCLFLTEATNDLGQLSKDIEETKSHDMINKIRELIAEKPDEEEHDDHEKDAKETKATKDKEQKKSDKQHKQLKPKDSIPSAHDADENAVARSIVNVQKHETTEVKKAKNAIDESAQANKRAFEKTKDFLRQIEDGILQFQNDF